MAIDCFDADVAVLREENGCEPSNKRGIGRSDVTNTYFRQGQGLHRPLAIFDRDDSLGEERVLFALILRL